MAQLNVNPTRMELSKAQKSLATAIRGHKLLKDKCDEMMRQFLDIVRENKVLRESVEKKLNDASNYMTVASSAMKKGSTDVCAVDAETGGRAGGFL